MHLTPHPRRALLALLLLGFLFGQFAQAARACTLLSSYGAGTAVPAGISALPAQTGPMAECDPKLSQNSSPCLASLTDAATQPLPAPALPAAFAPGACDGHRQPLGAFSAVALTVPPDDPGGGPSPYLRFGRLLI